MFAGETEIESDFLFFNHSLTLWCSFMLLILFLYSFKLYLPLGKCLKW